MSLPLRCLAALLACGCLCGCGTSQPPAAEQLFAKAEAASRSGDYEAGLELWTQLITLTPDDPAPYGNRGNCYSYLGNLDAALQDYGTAIEKATALTGSPNDPSLAYCYYNRGFAYDRAGKTAEAIRDYEATLKVNPQYPDVKNNLAWLLATSADSTLLNPLRAMQLAQAQCEETRWQDASSIDTYAAALAAANNYDRAAEMQQKALQILSDPELRAGMNKRLQLYQAKKPYVDDNDP